MHDALGVVGELSVDGRVMIAETKQQNHDLTTIKPRVDPDKGAHFFKVKGEK